MAGEPGWERRNLRRLIAWLITEKPAGQADKRFGVEAVAGTCRVGDIIR